MDSRDANVEIAGIEVMEAKDVILVPHALVEHAPAPMSVRLGV